MAAQDEHRRKDRENGNRELLIMNIRKLILVISILACNVLPREATGGELFWGLLERKDIRGIAEAIENGQDVNAEDERGRGALFVFADSLLSARAETKTWEISSQDLQIAQLMIEAGYDVRKKDNYDRTLLYTCIPLGPDFVELLLDASADPQIGSQGTNPPLFRSVSSNEYLTPEKWIKTIELLLRHGADVRAKTHDGEGILSFAAFSAPRYSPEMEQKLIDVLLDGGAEVNAANDWGHTPLMSWALVGRKATVQKLVNAGADVHAVDHYGVTPLGSAVGNPRPDGLKIMELLIKNGGDVHVRDNMNISLLHFASMLGDYAKSELLIKAGASIDDDTLGITPLHMAVGLMAVETDQNKGVSFQKRAKDALESYGYGTDNDFTKTLQVLLENGANLNVKSGVVSSDMILMPSRPILNVEDFYGKTPLEFARILGNTEAVKYLENWSAIHDAK
jgi:ankyrin repeat protein